MKRKCIFLLLTFGISAKVLGQEVSPCKIGQDKAKLLIDSGVIYFPRLTIEYTPTLLKLLELDHGIKDEIYDNGTDVELDDEAECFYQVMKTEIEKKWGRDFLRNQRRVANSLDKDGKGYKEPKENGIQDSITTYLRRKHPIDFVQNGLFLVNMKISPGKEVLNIAVLTGLPRATEISRKGNVYIFIKEAVNKVSKVYEPGQLRGKYVESTITFWIVLEN